MKNYWDHLESKYKSLIIFLLILLFRAYFAVTIGLADDEAYHWSWSDHLQLSYFDHPGMVAWMDYISRHIWGNTYWGVRFPAFVFYSLTIVFAWKLARNLFGEFAANFTGLTALWSLFWGFGGHVSSPEPYFMFYWVLGAWAFWQGVRDDGYAWSTRKTWIVLGVVMGLGLNSKFIISLLALGFGLFLITSSKHRKTLLSPWPWVGVLIATAIASPIFLWNIQNDWPSFKYQFYSRHSNQEFSLLRWGQFIGTQVGLYTPILYILLIFAYIQSCTDKISTRWKFLFSLTTPSILLFNIQPFFADYKPHWSGAAYFLLLAGVGHLLHVGYRLNRFQIIKPFSKAWIKALLIFFIPLNIYIYSSFFYPWIPKVYHLIYPNQNWNPRNDLSNEFFGWEELGAFLNRRQREIHFQTNKTPFLASHRYETTAQTYWGAKQKTYQLSFDVSHYSVSQRMQGIGNLIGEDTLFVMTEKYNDNPMDFATFDSCEKNELRTFRKQELSRIFYIYYCKNFQGIKR